MTASHDPDASISDMLDDSSTPDTELDTDTDTELVVVEDSPSRVSSFAAPPPSPSIGNEFSVAVWDDYQLPDREPVATNSAMITHSKPISASAGSATAAHTYTTPPRSLVTIGESVESFASGETAPKHSPVDPCWNIGGFGDAPLDNLMFGSQPDSPCRLARQARQMIEEALEPLTAAEHRRSDAMKIGRQRLSIRDGDNEVLWWPKLPDVLPLVGEETLVSWFYKSVRGVQTIPTISRVPEVDEAVMNSALRTAMQSTRQRRTGTKSSSSSSIAPMPVIAAPPGAPSAVLAAAAAGPDGYWAAFRAAMSGDVLVNGLTCVPCTKTILRFVPAQLLDPKIVAARLPERMNMLSGVCLQLAKASIRDLMDSCSPPLVFKIGITCNPVQRWQSYEQEGYTKFHLLYCSDESGSVKMLEAALIDMFQTVPGCRNVAKGGEGPSGRGPHFTYLALAEQRQFDTPNACRKRCRHKRYG